MKKMKLFGLGGILAIAMLCSSNAEARRLVVGHYFDNGCVGTHTYHSFLGFGWETYEVIAC